MVQRHNFGRRRRQFRDGLRHSERPSPTAPDTYVNANTNRDPDSNSDTNSNGVADSNANADTYAGPDTFTDPDTDRNAYADADPN